MPKFRIKIRYLMLAMVVFCTLAATFSQIGFATCEFIVADNDLELNSESGLLDGDLFCLYRDSDLSPQIHPPQLIRFEIHGVVNRQLLDLQAGRRHVVRFRKHPPWPIKKQDPFKRYIERDLGIPCDAIVGYVVTDQLTNVMINGH